MRPHLIRQERSVLLRAMLTTATLCVALPAGAQQQHLGPVDNLLLKNPYASPASGFFGRGLAAGDFDDDGISDLVVMEDGGERMRIFRGTDFTVGTDPLFNFFGTTVTTPSHSHVVASGDFDGDGRDEIAVSAFTTAVGGQLAAGRVHVMDRAPNGTWSVQSTIQAGGAYPGAPQAVANFGYSLAVGDFNDDGFADLAIGMRGQTVLGFANAGAIMITYGSANGITAGNARIINRTSDGLALAPREGDRFGWALAAGDFDADGDDDLAIGVLNATCPNGTDRAGAVIVLNGSPQNGISNAQSRIWRPGVQGIAGDCSVADDFGFALAAGRFGRRGWNAEPYDDLAIGAPETSGSAGAVHVLYGTASGLDAEGNQHLLPPALPGIISGAGRFGRSLATGVLARYCVVVTCQGDSLAVGAPFATVNGTASAGVVWTFHHDSSNRLDAASARPILPLPPLKISGPHANDQFGSTLAIGDFNGDSHSDLAIGVFLYDDGGNTDAGAVQVVYQSDFLFLDGFD